MKIQKVLLTILGVFGFSIGGAMTASHPAQAAVQQCNGLTEEECCEMALRENTIEALEEFLRLFPPGRSKGNTACSALALGALSQFQSNEDHETHDEDPSGGGYGQ